MSKSWEADDNFIMYLNSDDRRTHPLEPGVATVPSALRQELEISLSLTPDWQVALFSMYYTHSFSNVVLKSPIDFHCQVGYHHLGLLPVVVSSDIFTATQIEFLLCCFLVIIVLCLVFFSHFKNETDNKAITQGN